MGRYYRIDRTIHDFSIRNTHCYWYELHILYKTVEINWCSQVNKWAVSWQNQQMSVRPAKTQIRLGGCTHWLIRLGGCLGWSEYLLSAHSFEYLLSTHSFCWFCHVVAHMILWKVVPINWNYRKLTGRVYIANYWLIFSLSIISKFYYGKVTIMGHIHKMSFIKIFECPETGLQN